MIPKALDVYESAGSPEKALMAAVLRRAIFDALSKKVAYRKPHGNNEVYCDCNARIGARDWFFKGIKSDGSFFTFEQIAEALDIPKGPLLKFLRENEEWPELEPGETKIRSGHRV